MPSCSASTDGFIRARPPTCRVAPAFFLVWRAGGEDIHMSCSVQVMQALYTAPYIGNLVRICLLRPAQHFAGLSGCSEEITACSNSLLCALFARPHPPLSLSSVTRACVSLEPCRVSESSQPVSPTAEVHVVQAWEVLQILCISDPIKI